MADQDKIKVKHESGTVEIEVTPAGEAAATITLGTAEQARFVARMVRAEAGTEAEYEALFDVA